MSVTGRIRHLRPSKVYTFWISATRKIDLDMSVRLSVYNVQTIPNVENMIYSIKVDSSIKYLFVILIFNYTEHINFIGFSFTKFKIHKLLDPLRMTDVIHSRFNGTAHRCYFQT